MSSTPSPRGSARTAAVVPPRSRLALAAVALLATVLLGVWWAEGAGEPDLDVGIEPSRTERTDSLAADPESTRESTREVDAGAAAFAKTDAAAAAEAAVEKLTRHHVLIRVFDAATGKPVAGAEVFADPFDYVPGGDDEKWRSQLGHLRRTGQKSVTDAEGMVRLPVRPYGTVMAIHGSLFASDHCDVSRLTPRGLELFLRPTSRVLVRAKTIDSAPCPGLTIGLISTHRGGELPPERNDRRVGVTEDDGTLEVCLGEFLTSSQEPESLAFYVAEPGLTKVRVPFAIGQKEVEIVLPPHGSVRVRAVGSAQKPLPDLPRWSASLEADLESGDEGEREPYAGAMAVGVGGEVRFRYVGLGCGLTISCGSASDRRAEEVPGPVRSGQEVVHTIALADGAAFVSSGRLLDADGEPIPGARMRALGDGDSLGEANTDRDGRFWIAFRRHDEAPACDVTLAGIARAFGSVRFATARLERGSSYDWGDLRVEARAPFATGVLVTDAPIGPGARIEVDRLVEDGWRGDATLAIDLADDGTFAVQCLAAEEPIGARLRLQPFVPGFVRPQPIEFQKGQTVRFELERGPQFRARLLFEPSAAWYIERHGLDLLATNADGYSTYLQMRQQRGEWVFDSATLPPGIYTLAIESGSAFDDLARMDSVRVFAGEPDDPRLQPWDLRAAVQLMTVRLVDDKGKRLEADGEVYRRDPETGEWEACSSFEKGIAQSLTSAVPSELAIEVYERGTFRRSGVLGAIDVVVPEPQEVAVTIEGLPALRTGFSWFVDAEVPETWAKANGLPESTSPVLSTEWDGEKKRLSLSLSQPTDVALVFSVGDGREPVEVGRVSCSIPAGQKEQKIQVPATVVAGAAQWIDRSAETGR